MKSYPKFILLSIFLLIANLSPGQAPSWQWAKGAQFYWATEMKADNQGNVILTGTFNDSLVIGSYTFTTNGWHDIIVAKFSPSGNLMWATTVSGEENDLVNGLAVDASGDIYIAGSYTSKQFTVGPNVHNNAQTDSDPFMCSDVFVAKLDASGNVLWSQSFGHELQEYITDICLDPFGNLCITGQFYNAFAIGPYTLTPTPSPSGFGANYDVFVSKFSPGGQVLWALQYGGADSEHSGYITTDNHSNIILAGPFSNSAAFGTTTLTGNHDLDIYMVKLSASGSPIWVKGFYGPGYQFVSEVATDAQNNILLLGEPGHQLQVGSVTYTVHGGTDAFLAKFNSSGQLGWLRMIGGTENDWGRDVCTDASGGIYITGGFSGQTLFLDGIAVCTAPDTLGALILGFSPSGASTWISKIPGKGINGGLHLSVSANHELYFCGESNQQAMLGNDTIRAKGEKWISFLAKTQLSPVSTTGIPDRSEIAMVTLFPNPSSTTIELRFTAKATSFHKLRIMDNCGHEIRACSIKAAPDGREILDVSELPPGVYFISLETGKTTVVEKFVKL